MREMPKITTEVLMCQCITEAKINTTLPITECIIKGTGSVAVTSSWSCKFNICYRLKPGSSNNERIKRTIGFKSSDEYIKMEDKLKKISFSSGKSDDVDLMEQVHNFFFDCTQLPIMYLYKCTRRVRAYARTCIHKT